MIANDDNDDEEWYDPLTLYEIAGIFIGVGLVIVATFIAIITCLAKDKKPSFAIVTPETSLV